MAEFRKLPTQAELQQMLYAGQLQGKSTQDIINENLASGTTIKALPENFFTTAGAGAKKAAQFVNQAGTAQDIAKLFPGYTGQTTVPIPTSFNLAGKMDPYSGKVIPSGLQTQQIPYSDILKAIKPADVLGLTGTAQAYSDIGAGKAPKPMDVLDTVGLGAVMAKPAQLGFKTGKGLLEATKGLPVGMSIQDVSKAGLLETAPVSNIGFYSAVENAAMASPRKSAPGQAFLNDIMKGQDVRADEIKWMGLDDYLKGKQNVTKQEVQDYIANNRVDVQEVRSTIPRLPGEEMPGDKGAFLPKFGQYTLPGGENYRELLLTMPSNMSEYNKYTKALREKYGEGGFANLPLTDIERARLDKFYAAEDIDPYKSTHFPQENILAHLRVNDRVDADGKKMLLIEEVQSDWHQAGREKGYAGAESKAAESAFKQYSKELADKYDLNPEQNLAMYATMKRMQPDEVAKYEQLQSAWTASKGGVPDAPFKDTWYQLALKRAIQHAAENGYDRIGLTTGSRQAERFDLSKQVDNLLYDKNTDGTYRLSAQIQGRGQMIGESIPEEKLADYVGKEIAQKIAKGAGNKTEIAGKYDPVSMTSSKKYMTELSGEGLKVGGEGMKKYYDEIYPKFLDKYGKKWGAKIGQTTVPTDRVNVGGMPSMYPNQEPIRYLDITPQMKAGVSKGQPLFQAAPVITGGGLLGSQQDQRK